jgi:hypothetical protein
MILDFLKYLLLLFQITSKSKDILYHYNDYLFYLTKDNRKQVKDILEKMVVYIIEINIIYFL